MRLVFRVTLLCLACAIAGCGGDVLVIYLDDARWDSFQQAPEGTYPNLERLAATGITFTNAYAPTPACNPARATLMTGLRPGRHGIRGTAGELGKCDNYEDGGESLPRWIGADGHRTVFVGKWINRCDPKQFGIPPGWTVFSAYSGIATYGGELGATWTRTDGVEFPGCCGGQPRVNPKCLPDAACSDETTYAPRVMIDQALAELDAGGRNFVVYAPLTPHAGYNYRPIPRAADLGAMDDIPLWRPASWDVPGVAWGKPLPQPRQPEFTDAIRRRHLESLMALDDDLGRVLDEAASRLPGNGLVIVLTSDNGVTWGEHAMWSQWKMCPYKECQRIPLIVRMPDEDQRVVDAPVLMQDFAPTFADLMGARDHIPDDLDGRSFVPLLHGDTPEDWRTDYCMEGWSNEPGLTYRGVRDPARGLVYVEYDSGAVELFDLERDPAEMINVAALPAYTVTRAQLEARLTQVCGSESTNP